MPLFEQFPYTNFHDLNLDQIAKKIEELEGLKQAIAEVNALAIALREEMNTVEGRIDNIENLYDSFVDTINRRFNELAQSLRDDITLLERDLQQQLEDYEEQTDLRMDGFEASLFTLDARLTHVLNNLPSEIQIVSPYTGELTSLDVLIYQLANGGRSDSLTAAAYDALALTASAYEAYNITAYQYDWSAATILV